MFRFKSASIFCSLLLTAAAVAQQPAPAPVPAQPTPPPPAKVEGPMRVEVLGIMEQRVALIGEAPERAPKSGTRMFFKLTGARLADLYRVGKLIVEEISDDVGTNMLDLTTFTDRDKVDMNPVNLQAGALANGYLMLDVTPNQSPRAAKKLTKLKGYVNVQYGGPSDDVTIENPLQYEGKEITHPKLKELGLKITVLPSGSGGEQPTEKGITLKVEGEDRIKSAEFYDDWLRKTNVRPRPGKNPGETFYSFGAAKIDADSQLVLSVFRKLEKEKIVVDINNIDFP